MLDRREFVVSALATLAAGCARGAARAAAPTAPAAPRLAFSTLGCPSWSWPRIVDFAAANGYTGIELRGIGQQMDLPLVPELGAARVADTRKQLADRGLAVAGLGASANMHEPDPAKRAGHMAEARRFIDLAGALGAPYVRVFGNNWVKDEPREATLARVGAGLRELGAYAQERGNVAVLVETHGDYVDSATIETIMRHADHPRAAVLWDAHHTFVDGKEDPAFTADRIMKWVRHTHLKDSRPGAKDRDYVLTGDGEVPVRRQIEVLRAHGYRGFYGFEWEKRWHPEIPEPEVAFVDFARKARTYFGAA